MSVFVRQEKITVRFGLQSDPIDPTKTRLCIKYFFPWSKTHILHQNKLDINLRAPLKAIKPSNIYVNQFQS